MDEPTISSASLALGGDRQTAAYAGAADSRSIALVLLAGCLWSTAGVAVRLMEVAGHWQILLYRSLFLLPVAALLLLVSSDTPVTRAYRGIGLAGLIGSLCLAISSIMYIIALTHTTVANTVVLVATAPFWTALLARAIVGERVRSVTWVTMSIAAVGIVVMVWGGLASGNWWGNLAALVAALGFAGVTVSLRFGRAVNMFPMVSAAAVWTALTSAVFISLDGARFAVPLSDLSLALNMAAVQMGLGGLCYTLGSRRIAAAELTLLSFSEVVLAPLLVWLVIAETPAASTLVGGVIVLSAIALRALHGIKRPPPVRMI